MSSQESKIVKKMTLNKFRMDGLLSETKEVSFFNKGTILLISIEGKTDGGHDVNIVWLSADQVQAIIKEYIAINGEIK